MWTPTAVGPHPTLEKKSMQATTPERPRTVRTILALVAGALTWVPMYFVAVAVISATVGDDLSRLGGALLLAGIAAPLVSATVTVLVLPPSTRRRLLLATVLGTVPSALVMTGVAWSTNVEASSRGFDVGGGLGRSLAFVVAIAAVTALVVAWIRGRSSRAA